MLDNDEFTWDNLSNDDFIATEDPLKIAVEEEKIEVQGTEPTEEEKPVIFTEEDRLASLSDEAFIVDEKEEPDPTPSKMEKGDEDKVANNVAKLTDKKEEIAASEEEINKFYKSKAKLMVENGVFKTIDLSTELEEGETLTEEKYVGLQEKEVDNRVNEVIDGWKGSIGDVGTRFVRYTMNGGNPQDFINLVSETPNFSKFDLTNESDVDKAALAYLTRVDGKDAEEARDLVNYYKDKGSLATKVTNWTAKAATQQAAAETAAVARQEKENIDRVERREARKQGFHKIATSVDSVSGVKISKGAKKAMASYMADPVVKVEGSNEYLSQLNSDLGDIYKDPESLVALASLVKRYNKESKTFDLSDIKAEGKKEEIKKVKNTLMATQEGNTPVVATNVNAHKVVKSLADFL